MGRSVPHPNIEKDDHKSLEVERRLNIHDMHINDPFTMKTENKLGESSPFQLYNPSTFYSRFHKTFANFSKSSLQNPEAREQLASLSAKFVLNLRSPKRNIKLR